MPVPDSKELYMMNGGQKLYIYKDGFGDVYNATATEEAAWQAELVTSGLVKMDTETNSVCLKFVIENLNYHNYPGLDSLLEKKLAASTGSRKIVFATSLWTLYKSTKSFPVIEEALQNNRSALLDNIFLALIEFHNNFPARQLLINCIESDDDVLIAKAKVTLVMWAYSGLAALRENNMLESLIPANKRTATFKDALEKVKTILFNRKK